MKIIYYKGYKVETTPYQLAKSRRWASEYKIIYPRGNGILAKMFSEDWVLFLITNCDIRSFGKIGSISNISIWLANFLKA